MISNDTSEKLRASPEILNAQKELLEMFSIFDDFSILI